MAKHMTNDLAVVIHDQHHWNRIAEREDHADEQARIKWIGEIVKRAGGQVALCERNERDLLKIIQ